MNMTRLEIRLEELQSEMDLAEWRTDRIVALVQDISDHAKTLGEAALLPAVSSVDAVFECRKRRVVIAPLTDITYKWRFLHGLSGVYAISFESPPEPEILQAVQLFLRCSDVDANKVAHAALGEAQRLIAELPGAMDL